MRIKSVEVKNFRSFKNCFVKMDRYNALVGANGAGKSTLLCALNVFFRENESATTSTSELSLEDFFQKDSSLPIEITVSFTELSDSAMVDFAAYVRGGDLVVTAKATYDVASGLASVRQFGQRLGFSDFKPFFEAFESGAPVVQLKAIFAGLREKYPGIDAATTKDSMRQALRVFEDNNPESSTLIPSEDQFYGFSRGTNLLSRYVQWIYVPAVKDASKENMETKTNTVGKLLSRTVRSVVNFDEKVNELRADTLTKYRELLAEQQVALNGISAALTNRLAQWSHPNAFARVEWSEDPKRSVQVDEPTAKVIAGEGAFEGELARFGHGLQRSYILALLQELASIDSSSAPTLILGCEEPELYQHPPQARHLAQVLAKLSTGNSQVILTTHSPLFVSGQFFENLRAVRRNHENGTSSISYIDMEDFASTLETVRGHKPTALPAHIARLQQSLQPQLNEIFFSSKVILVEGIEDVAFITSWMILKDFWDDFRRKGLHLVHADGKDKLIVPTVVARKLGIPIFVVFDSDGNTVDASARGHHERDNTALLKALGADGSETFPIATVWAENFVQWPTNLGDTFKSEVDNGAWDKAYGLASKYLGNPSGSFAKNPVHIGALLANLYDMDIEIPSLQKLCEKLLE